MNIIKKSASLTIFGVILLIISAIGVRMDPLDKTSSGGYETNDLSKIFVLIGWIGIAILLVNLFRFIKHRTIRP